MEPPFLIPSGVRCWIRVAGHPWWASKTEMEHLVVEAIDADEAFITFRFEGKEIRVVSDELLE